MPDDQNLDDFITGIPKAELHVHLEGTLEKEQMCEIGERNGVALPRSCTDLRDEAHHFSDLQSFLDLYYEGVSVLVSERDFHDLTAAYARRAHADGARHVEAFFDPQSRVSRGVRFAVVVEGGPRGARGGRAQARLELRASSSASCVTGAPRARR